MSLAIIAAVGAVVVGGTTAYYSDVETSTGNTFTAGSLDLKISNEAHYSNMPNGTELDWDLGDIADDGGVTMTSPFIYFTDVKPGDWGYNKITAKVLDNDAYAQLTITKTLDADVTCTGPESKVSEPQDPQCGIGGTGIPGNGELDEAVFAIVWADNGDGVKQAGEPLLFASNSNQDTGWSNLHSPISQNGELTGDTDYALTIGWCIGLPEGVTAGYSGDDNMATLYGSEVNIKHCDGSGVDNRSQSDTLVADVLFEIQQKRNQTNPFGN